MSHSLNIERVISEWKVPRDQSVDSLSVDTLNDLATRQLSHALAVFLERICPDQDESIWLIRRLNVSLGVDLSWKKAELVDRWAHRLTLSLLKIMQSDIDNQSVFHYRSRAEYMAAFMTDVACGSAWNKWQYASFSGLAALSSSAVVRSLLATETSAALTALAMLTPCTLRRVIGTLFSHDAAQCWMRLTHSHVPAGDGMLLRALDAWETDREVFPFSGCLERDFLWLLARVLSREKKPESAWQESATAAAAVIALDQFLKDIPAERWQEAESKLLSGRTAELAPDPSTRVESLRTWIDRPDVLQRGLGAITSKSTVREEFRSTALGCVFFLLPLIEQLAAEDWSKQPALLKFAVLVQCCSIEMRVAARSDSLLRDLFGVPSDLDLDQLEFTVDPDAVKKKIKYEKKEN